MPPKMKARSIRRRKRKFNRNQYTEKQQSSQKVSGDDTVSVTDDLGPSDQNIIEDEMEMSEEVETPKSRRDPASIRKLSMATANDSSFEDSEESETEEVDNNATGFRLIDISILAEVIELLRCTDCKSYVKLDEESKAKMELACCLKISCSRFCGFSKQFYTSARIGQAFEVNRRAVLATRNVGVGHKGLVKLAGVLNMPQPMNKNA